MFHAMVESRSKAQAFIPVPLRTRYRTLKALYHSSPLHLKQSRTYTRVSVRNLPGQPMGSSKMGSAFILKASFGVSKAQKFLKSNGIFL